MDQHFKQEKSSLPLGTPKVDSIESLDGVKSFQPQTFSSNVVHSYEPPKEGDLRGRFNLHPAAKKSLGIEKEENRHLEVKIAEEVEKRILILGEKAKQDGFNQGKIDGEKLALEEFNKQAQPVFERFLTVLQDFENAKNEIYQANEQFLIQLVFQVAREVTLKEVKADPEYIKKLCTLLVEKIGAKDHVKIKMGRDDFSQVETIRDYLKQQFLDLKNIQIDVSDDFQNGGCKVETDLSRINASVDTQLQLINQSLGAS